MFSESRLRPGTWLPGATGARLPQLPATRQRVLAALGAVQALA